MPGLRQHLRGELHRIGFEIAEPKSVPVAHGVPAKGVALEAARADHVHFGARTYILNGVANPGSRAVTSFADYPGPLEVSFDKIRSDTDLIVHGFVGAYRTTGAGSIVVGLLINGVDYTLGHLFFNTLSDHNQITFHVSLNEIADAWAIARVPIGQYAARVRWSSSATANADSNDRVQLTIHEEVGIE